ncbi:hypothetical protein AVEN_5445-1 [Araneus ventricosus]|uniref:Uncharacterized protein n=1 Tax=Araneus ventricosus TaxID=182803 RepID=A0A4Y2DZQ5_ARAVE|nr:hypothetical protein AVEN_5445-1 [Araneus ventricosus]
MRPVISQEIQVNPSSFSKRETAIVGEINILLRLFVNTAGRGPGGAVIEVDEPPPSATAGPLYVNNLMAKRTEELFSRLIPISILFLDKIPVMESVKHKIPKGSQPGMSEIIVLFIIRREVDLLLWPMHKEKKKRLLLESYYFCSTPA